MKKLFILLIFLVLLGCNNIIKNKQTSKDFNCPRVYFSNQDRVFINSTSSLDDVSMKVVFNNFAINKKCIQTDEIAIIPLDILVIAQPLSNLQDSEFSIPVYVSLLDQDDNLLENQYFMISSSVLKNSEINIYIESNITDRLDIITQYLETTQVVIGFMLDDKKRELLN